MLAIVCVSDQMRPLFGVGGRMTMTQLEDVARRRLQDWVISNCRKKGISPSACALELKIAKTTLTNFLNDKLSTRILSGRTIAKLEAFFGEQAPQLVDNLQSSPGRAEPSLEKFDFSTAQEHEAETIRLFIGSSSTRTAWRITSPALIKIGLAPGDTIIVDDALKPGPHGSLVVAEVFDMQTKTSKRIVRIYDEGAVSLLSAATLDEDLRRPMIVDGSLVRVVGVVVWQMVDRTKRRLDIQSN